MTKCATVGCRNVATEEIAYRLRGEPGVDSVCTQCADSYERRPALAGFTREPLLMAFAGIPNAHDEDNEPF